MKTKYIVMPLTLLVATLFLVIGPGSASAADAQQLFEEASRLQNDGRFAPALAKWREFISSYPKDSSVGQAYGGLGVCFLETGEPAKAVEAFDQALSRLPKGEMGESLHWNRAIACYRRAEQSKKATDYQAAAKALEAFAGAPDTPKERKNLAAFYLAKVEQSEGKTDSARQRFQKLVATDSGIAPHALLALAGMAEEAKDWPEAIRLYRTHLHDFAKHASADEARLGLADALLKLKNYEEAEQLFGELRQRAQFANAPYALYRWGEAAYLRGEYRTAVERLTQFLEEQPKSPYRPAALLAAGEARMQLKDYAAAAKTFGQFVTQFANHPERPRLQLRLGQALYQAGNAAEAEKTVQELAKSLDDELLRGEALVLYARCAAKLNHAAEAVRRYEACFAARVKSDEPEQVRSEAVAQAFAAGDSERGLHWADTLVKEAPASASASEAQLHAARWLAEQSQLAESLQRSRWVLDAKISGSQALALYLSGFCELRLRKFEDAVKHFEDLLDHHPHFEQAPAACYSLGIAQEALGAKSKAVDAYRKMEKDYPDDPLTRKARERVKALQTDG
jgi:TolA-binding protein